MNIVKWFPRFRGKGVEHHAFSFDKNLATLLIERQNTTHAEALAELVMNSVDAGASRIDISAFPEQLSVVDNGRGFGSKRNLIDAFRVFGKEHDGSVTYGRFGMGRAQILNFGVCHWETGSYRITFDKRSRTGGFSLEPGQRSIGGCVVSCAFFNAINPYMLKELERTLRRKVVLVDCRITLNGSLITAPVAELPWDFEDEVAYYAYNDKTLGANPVESGVYNQGVWLGSEVGRGFKSRFFENHAVIVSSKPGYAFELTLDRNALIKDCPLAARVSATLFKVAAQSALAQAITPQSASLILSAWKRGLLATDIAHVPLFYPLRRTKGVSPKALLHELLRKDVYVRPQGRLSAHARRLDDKVIQSGRYVVFADEELQNSLIDLLKSITGHALPREVKVWDLEDFSLEDFTDETILNEAEYTRDEAMLVSTLSRTLRFHGTFVIGTSATAYAWTNGRDYVALERDFTAACLNEGVVGLMRLWLMIMHELCHDSESYGTDVHGEAFYQTFHDKVTDPWEQENFIEFAKYHLRKMMAAQTISKGMARKLNLVPVAAHVTEQLLDWRNDDFMAFYELEQRLVAGEEISPEVPGLARFKAAHLVKAGKGKLTLTQVGWNLASLLRQELAQRGPLEDAGPCRKDHYQIPPNKLRSL